MISQDPKTQIIHHYLTSLRSNLPPGTIAQLSKAHWDIGKVFDEFKDNLCETKAWVSSPTAKIQQARLLCLTHNLMTLIDDQIQNEAA
ncbi:MAG: hypothetical protein ORN51_04625 [Akkermansiaceae bacterium]|nr:hypothetical protein [Akkermansiaceae bacterium]